MMDTVRVLVVDDEPLIRETLVELLEDEGFTVVGQAVDGAEAVREVDALSPDVVLIDVRMPIVNGIEATRRILALRPETVVIALSAYDDPALAAAAREAGAADYVAKGTPSRELLRRIREAAEARA
jgi:DNA-binding NarL/FixJ family response regulator